MMRYIGIIPARYGSSRFPGKPLALLGGKTVIERVYEQASKALEEVYVATDDERIYDEVLRFGGKAIMTRADHKCGTDRIRESLSPALKGHPLPQGERENTLTEEELRDTVIINVQGDEPFIQPEQIETVKRCFEPSPEGKEADIAPEGKERQTDIATLVKPIEEEEEIFNPNNVKAIFNEKMEAVYFSRLPIPYLRGVEQSEWVKQHRHYKHIGMYAYRAEVLMEITELPQSPLEKAESLEQLRWLEAGYTIRVGITDTQTIGIDTPEDLEEAEAVLGQITDKR